MDGTHITIRLDVDLARDARAFAARRGTSLSRLVAEQLETLVRADPPYAEARRRALARLKRGYDMRAKRPLGRDEVHDRESLR